MALLTIFTEFVGDVLKANFRKDFTCTQPIIASKVEDEWMTTGNFVGEFHIRGIVFIGTNYQLSHVGIFVKGFWEWTEHIVEMIAWKGNIAFNIQFLSTEGPCYSKQILVIVECGKRDGFVLILKEPGSQLPFIVIHFEINHMNSLGRFESGETMKPFVTMVSGVPVGEE